MKGLAIVATGQVEVIEVPKPSPGPDDVLLRIQYVGFCGSDLSTFRGRNPLVAFRRIPGHEASAKIVELGANVPTNFKPGMAVTLSPYTSCGKCPACLHGRQNACCNNQTLGVQRDGVMTEYAVVPWRTIFPSELLTPRELALVEPLAVGFHATARGEVESSDVVAVFGCGAVGLGVVSGAASRNARVIAIGRNNDKLALAKRVGASETINSSEHQLEARLHDLTEGGPDVVVEAVGDASTFQAAAELVAPCGRVVYVGYAREPASFDTARDFVRKEIDIRGSRNAISGDFAGVIRMLEGKRFPVEELITKVVSMEDAGEALRDWDEDTSRVVRILVKMDA